MTCSNCASAAAIVVSRLQHAAVAIARDGIARVQRERALERASRRRDVLAFELRASRRATGERPRRDADSARGADLFAWRRG